MSDDIKPQNLANLFWDPEHGSTSLLTTYEKAQEHAQSAINWYLRARRPKRLCGRATRLGAIGCTFIAGVLPVLIQIYTVNGKAPLSRHGPRSRWPSPCSSSSSIDSSAVPAHGCASFPQSTTFGGGCMNSNWIGRPTRQPGRHTLAGASPANARLL